VHEQLSIWGLIAEASGLVQMVMLVLMILSVVSIALIVKRFLVFKEAQTSFAKFEDYFWSGVDLSTLYREGTERSEQGEIGGAEAIFRAGFKEFSRVRRTFVNDPDAIMAGTERAMRVALSREQEKLERSLPFLANVASVSPYIGLFGTVWGIMSSFRALANVDQASLAMVAPGISEALIATAMGLFAAIPAVLAFNRYSAKLDRVLAGYTNFAEEFSAILHRQAHVKRDVDTRTAAKQASN